MEYKKLILSSEFTSEGASGRWALLLASLSSTINDIDGWERLMGGLTTYDVFTGECECELKSRTTDTDITPVITVYNPSTSTEIIVEYDYKTDMADSATIPAADKISTMVLLLDICEYVTSSDDDKPLSTRTDSDKILKDIYSIPLSVLFSGLELFATKAEDDIRVTVSHPKLSNGGFEVILAKDFISGRQ